MRAKQKGQAIVMVTLSLIAMCGILGLAVDLGWSYFVRRSGQAFADSGALASAITAFRTGGPTAAHYCGITGIPCNTPSTSPCPVSIATASNNLENGCLYTRGNTSGSTYSGFVDGANAGRTQTANFEAGEGVLQLDNGARINTFYWVRARVSEQIPQLFSAVMGNRMALVAARGTAAIVGLPLDDSILLTNREYETAPVGQNGANSTGKDLYVSGSSGVNVPAGIRLAANRALSGEIGSNGTVSARHTWTRETQGTANWSYSQKSDSGMRFHDPFEGMGINGNPAQPPLTTTPKPDCPILAAQNGNAQIDGGSPNSPLLLAPGNYYAARADGTPTFGRVTIRNNSYVKFTATASSTPSTVFTYAGKSTSPCMVGQEGSGSAFGEYFIYGGLDVSGGRMIVEPGRYVLAGVNGSNEVFSISSGGSLVDINGNPDPPSSPGINGGEVFVLTRPDYPGMANQLSSIPRLAAGALNRSNLDFGSVNIQSGQNNTPIESLHGLTPGLSDTDPLKRFESVLFWQDQRNSRTAYRPDGNIKTGDGSYNGGFGCNPWTSAIAAGINNPCQNSLANSNSPQFSYQGGANSRVYGIFYQPRGAWMILQGGGLSANNNKTMIISGALQTGGNSIINFGPLTNPPIERIVALVE